MAGSWARSAASCWATQCAPKSGWTGCAPRWQRLYGDPPRLLLGTALHLVGWFGTGVCTWISLRLLGHPVDLVHVLALEALLDAVIAAAFVVPGAAGVQEAGYVGLGAVFGVPPEIALSVSLLRRAREISWGLPVLGIWQWQEVRRL